MPDKPTKNKEENERISPSKKPQPPRDTNKEDVITNAMDFWKKIYEEKVSFIKFTKQNGEVRYMRATLDFSLIPADRRPKKLDMVQILTLVRKNGIIRVFDLDKKEWRSVPFERVEWLKTASQKTYYIRKEGRF